jgi:PhoH-like ATPase
MTEQFYIIDTNIPLQYPYFLNSLQNCNVIIPLTVLNEIDTFKKDNDLGKNARAFSRILDELYSFDNMTDNNVQVIYMESPEHIIMQSLGGNTVDNTIIAIAVNIRNGGNQVKILSNDILVRVKARGANLNASGFTSESSGTISQEIYTGVIEAEIDVDSMDILLKQGYLNSSNIYNTTLYPHMFMILKNSALNSSAIVKVSADCNKIEVINDLKQQIWGITPRNAEQRMALQLLLDPDIPLVTISGKAGTGKTLLALATGLVSMDEKLYEKMILTKPVVPMGKDIGYLPGSKEEKLNPWLQSYFDNMEQLLDKTYMDLEQMKVHLEALTYIRGRTLPRQYIIIDEAQNLSKHEVKTIITRAGEGAKIILMGDPDQIDTPFLDGMNNGLVYVINKFKDQNVAGHITLTKGQRSKLASVAIQIM